MIYKILDVVMNPELQNPDGNELPNIVGEEAITFMDILMYSLILLICAGLLFVVVKKIRKIKNENV
ncbi:MAG: hypothetical protein ACVCEJ_03000 [Candidatus Izemoplasmataceae bacterium]